MKIKIYSLYSKLISACLILLGFNSCDSDPVDEYGSPSAKYKVNGKVVTSEGNKESIKNIRVVMIEDVKESEYIIGDTVYTDTDGKFEINRNDTPYNKFVIRFKDIDGEDNGGLFEDKEEIIEFNSSDYKNGGRWYVGEAEKDMGTIELTIKEEAEEEPI